MRPTLHDYNLHKLSELDCTAISDVLNFTKLTNRAPRFGDFVGENAIFKGDWEVANHIGKDPLITNGKHFLVWKNGICNHYNKGCLGIYRIEELPREIEFKDGVI